MSYYSHSSTIYEYKTVKHSVVKVNIVGIAFVNTIYNIKTHHYLLMWGNILLRLPDRIPQGYIMFALEGRG
jgi:hypothetical protein